MPSRKRYLTQTPSTLDVCIHKDDTERGNMTIYHQQLPRRTLSAFYCHHSLAQMRHLAMSYSATQEMKGNW